MGAGLKVCMTAGLQEWRNKVKEGCRREKMQKRKHAGQDRCRRGEME